MEILISLGSAAAVIIAIFTGTHFGSSAIENKIRTGLSNGSDQLIQISPGLNAKTAEITIKSKVA